MTGEQGYNGWENYETWCMALWIDNDEGSYTYSRELREPFEKDEDDPDSEPDTVGYADALKDWQEEQMPELEVSVWLDLLRASFGEIDWYEIAENYLSELQEQDA